MATNPKQQHRGHPKRIISLDQGGRGPGSHYGRIECVLCNKFVAWATKEQVLAQIRKETVNG
jgi:hypothetical protein